MDSLINEIVRIQKAYPLERKVLLARSRHQGGILLKRAAAETGLIDFRSMTITDLAELLISKEMAISGLIRINDLEKRVIMEEALLTAKDHEYFARLNITPSMIDMLVKATDLLRMNSAKATEASKVMIDATKGAELALVLSAYEIALRDRQLIDEAGILSTAITVLDQEPVIACLHPFLFPSRLESEFLSTSLAKTYHLPFLPVAGLTEPPELEGIPRVKPSPLSFLFEPESRDVEHNGTISIKSAIGTENEISDVFAEIISSGHAFDDVEISCPIDDDYLSAFEDEAYRLHIPISIGIERRLRNCAAKLAAKAITDWIRSGFRSEMLYDALRQGCFTFDHQGNAVRSDYLMAKALRQEKIGWGLGRYKEFIERSEPGEFHTGEMTMPIAYLQSFFRCLLACLADDLEHATMAELASITLNAIHGLCLEIDKSGADSRVVDLLKLLISHNKTSRPLGETCRLLQNELAEIRCDRDGPKPGAIFVSSIKDPGISGRPWLFLIGINPGVFPYRQSADPILLDIERSALGLPTSRQIMQRNLFSQASALAGHTGELRISFQSFTLSPLDEAAPGSLVLQAYRFKTGDFEADYADCLASLSEPAGFIKPADRCISQDEFLISRSTAADQRGLGLAISSRLIPTIKDAATVMGLRAGDTLSPWDGLVSSSSLGLKSVVSASQIEKLATCPRKFFYQYELGIKPLDELVYERGRWLDGRAKGTFLHRVFMRFGRALRASNYNYAIADKLMDEIFETELMATQEEIPFPDLSVLLQSITDLRHDLAIFLEREINEQDHFSPRYFELSFGCESLVEDNDMGLFEPVIIPTRAGQIGFRGMIDRIDQTETGNFIVVDYKTGNSRKYFNSPYFGGGKLLQWAIYIYAAEEFLRRCENREAKVTEAHYYCPTIIGKGLRSSRPAEKAREKLPEILAELIEIAARGVFLPIDDTTCKYCDYSSACFATESEKAAIASMIKRKTKNRADVSETSARIRSYK